MSLKRSLSWMSFSQLVSVALQFTASIVLAHFLSPRQMGIFAVAAATVGLLSLVQTFGLQSMIVRQEHLTSDLERCGFTINAIINVSLALLIFLTSRLGARQFADSDVRLVLTGLSLNPIFGIFDFLPGAHLERQGRFKAIAVAGLSCTTASAITTIVAALLGASFMTAVYAGWTNALVYVAVVNILGRRHVSFRLGLKQWRPVALFGLQMLATSGLHSIGSRLSDVCLAKVQGLAALGIYGRANNFNGLVWTNLHTVAARVMFVDFADIHRRKVSLRERYIRTVDVMTLMLWPAFAGLAVLAGPFIRLLYGERWASAALPMSLLAISSIILVSSTMTWELFTATGKLATQTRIEFVLAFVNTLAFVFGCRFGLIFAATARILGAAVSVAVYRPFVGRMTDTKYRDFVPIYCRNSVLSFIAISPALFTMIIFRFSPKVPQYLVFTSVFSGVILWSLGLIVLKHPLVDQGKGLLSRGRFLNGRGPISQAVLSAFKADARSGEV